MENLIKLFAEESNIKKNTISIHNFADPFVKIIMKEIDSNCDIRLNNDLRDSIKKNSKKEIFSYLPKVLITESYIYKLQKELDNDDMNRYIYSIYKDGCTLKKMLEIYPFLFKFLLKRCSYISNIYIDLINKISVDYPQLIESGLIDRGEKLLSIDRESGDSHSNGQKVMELKFDKHSIFYKPKNSNLTEILFSIQKWIESKSDLKFYQYKILNKDNYAYEEKVEHNFAEDSLTLNKYYYNFGATLALIYILNGTDYHFENIIAHHEFPVMIDNETLFNPALSNYNIDIHLLSTGMLPNKKYSIDFSSLTGSLTKQKILVEQLTETKESFVLEKRDFYIKKRKNQPSKEINFTYIYKKEKKHLLLGFKKLISVFIENKEDFLNSEVLKKIKNEKIRIVVRHTMYYHELLSKLFHPYHVQTLNTARTFLRNNLTQNDHLKQLESIEESQLINGDIPIFHMKMTANYLLENNLYIVSKKTPLEAFTDKIHDLKPKDLLLSENIVLKILNSYYEEDVYG
ncbi:DUF4135 domain-containing protein [Staphylococcus pseudintermedius]|uniref:DUF4135 domain-containing protein n=1 Tax=Staphylococcus pseudintermedius TaxID=283734 RepID=UPI001BDF1EFF|nr:DUF4135 domain-containing protein [Staphylococcus pseudintermedius]EJA1860817.1 DUF4135 domain-containing protein [Staphylococcus pseudintermedius]EKH2200373.1 DUF4135 domain-containing protein [Staphylococcus pseudintermedius]EMB9414034.1 DUF4135 domain-containing protein [Staphylococcus pseudintermedius]HCA7013336.1 DUF4135 domain-containing protein [Staphylococcus pseudintermedius]